MKNFRKVSAIAMPMLFLSLGAWGLENRNPIDAAIDLSNSLSGGTISHLRPPPPNRHMAYPFVADTPSYQPDLPTPAARAALTQELEAQRNAIQRWGASSGVLISPGYTPPPPIPEVIFDKHGHPIRTVIRETDYNDASIADALNEEFLSNLESQQKKIDATPATQLEKKSVATVETNKSTTTPTMVPFGDGIYWPWVAVSKEFNRPPQKTQVNKVEVHKTKPVKTTSLWPQKPLPLPALLYEAHDLSVPRQNELPVVPPAPPEPHSTRGFEIPDQAPDYVPDLDYGDPSGILVRFQDQSDQMAAAQGDTFDKILTERGGRRIKITGFGGTFDTNLGLNINDQIREINFGMLRAKAVARQLRDLGVPVASMMLAAEPIGDGARVSFLD